MILTYIDLLVASKTRLQDSSQPKRGWVPYPSQIRRGGCFARHPIARNRDQPLSRKSRADQFSVALQARAYQCGGSVAPFDAL
jgi:hypothetical protein